MSALSLSRFIFSLSSIGIQSVLSSQIHVQGEGRQVGEAGGLAAPLPFRQVFEDLEDEFAFGEDNHPGRQEDEHEVRPETDVILIPHLKRTLVGGDDLGIGVINRHALLHALRQQGFFVAEDYGTDAGQTRLDVVNLGLNLVAVWCECLVHQWTWTDDGHVAKEDVEYLRELVYLRLSEEASERQDARIAFGRVQSARHVRAITKHGRKLQNLEVLISVADAILSVEYIMLACAFEDNHNWYQQWRQDDNCDAGEDDIEEALEEFVHMRGLSSCVLDRINRIYRILATEDTKDTEMYL